MGWFLPLLSLAILITPVAGQTQQVDLGPGAVPVADNVAVQRLIYKGKPALQIVDRAVGADEDRMVMLPVKDFHNGVIEVWLAGLPKAGAPGGARGFVGIAFRVQADPKRYEAFYIRPTNGRAEDQLRRNHSTQYVSMPDHPWPLLREKTPGVYESHADMVPGEWIKLRIEARGDKARFYLGGSAQPALIVNDLKLGADAKGGIALWIGINTEAYFADLSVTKED